jgi:hypothetical protein
MLAYGVVGDLIDEYLRMSKSTCLEFMYKFCKAEETTRLLSINEGRGFLGMIGSIDWMHWEWKNCPFA